LTPEDLSLDPDVFVKNQSLTLYRLARARYANLSGVGAALAPGRWNRTGQEAIYTSTEIGVPMLERLVHTPKDLIPSNLALMRIRVSGIWENVSDRWHILLQDRDTTGRFLLYRTLAAARRGGGPKAFAMAVPSVIVPVWNVVLYPQEHAFWQHVALESVEKFEFDPRLFPENTPIETPGQK
jgi:RES domain-containing protein